MAELTQEREFQIYRTIYESGEPEFMALRRSGLELDGNTLTITANRANAKVISENFRTVVRAFRRNLGVNLSLNLYQQVGAKYRLISQNRAIKAWGES